MSAQKIQKKLKFKALNNPLFPFIAASKSNTGNGEACKENF